MTRNLVLLTAIWFAMCVGIAGATPVLFGPTPYIASADWPAGLFGGSEQIWSFDTPTPADVAFAGPTPDAFRRAPGPLTDSVDSGGWSFVNKNQDDANGDDIPDTLVNVIFEFATPVDAAGIVVTDGEDMIEGGIYFNVVDGNDVRTTYGGPDGFLFLDESLPVVDAAMDDRFIGIQDTVNKIKSIEILGARNATHLGHYSGVEVDDLAWEIVPEPATLLLAFLAAAGLYRLMRRGLI